MENWMAAENRACRSTGSRFQKSKKRGRGSIKRLRADMAEISKLQKRIRDGQMEVIEEQMEMRESVQAIECKLYQLRKVLLLSKQDPRFQRSLNEMSEILIAQENSNLSEADGGLIQCPREEEGKHEE